MRLTDLLALSHVPRWSIVDHLKPQSVADHTFRVLVIALEICGRLSITVDGNFLTYIISHDGAESRTADLPATMKEELINAGFDDIKFCPWMENPMLTTDQAIVVHLADKIEALTFIYRYGVGSHAKKVTERQRERVFRHCPPNWEGVVAEIVEQIQEDSGR